MLTTILLVAIPLSAQAATGPVTINVATLTADMDNSAAVATESQWSYDHTRRILSLTTADGEYTLTGTNHTGLAIYANALDAHITLNSLFTTGTNTLGLGALTLAQSCRITSVLGSELSATTAAGLDLNADVACLIDGSGVLSFVGSSTGSGIALVDDSASLTISGSGIVWAQGGTGRPALSALGIFSFVEGSTSILMMDNNSTLDEEHTFFVDGFSTVYKWKLQDDLTSDWLFASSIDTSLAPGTYGSLSRVPRLTVPTLDVILSDTALHFIFTEIGTSRDVNVDELWAGTVAIGDWDWEIVDNTDPTVAYTPGSYGINPAPIAIVAGAPGTTVITIKTIEYAFVSSSKNGLTDRFGYATITVTVDDPVPASITGPTTLKLTEGYSATSTGAFTVTGIPAPTVVKTSGNPAITWNATTGKLDIAAGLAPGTYPVELTAANDYGEPATTLFTLTVVKAPPGTDLPDGGDTTALGTWLCVLTLAGTVLCGSAFLRKRASVRSRHA